MNSKDSLGDRIKAYEDSYRNYLPHRLPIIIRLDGQHFSGYLRGCQKPFDQNVIDCLDETATYLCKNISGTKLAYLQSDEISLLIYNYNFKSQGWFNNNLQKMVSVSASLASSYFTSVSHRIFGQTKLASFDSRAFVVPNDEVVNSFLFRQQDCERNSVQSLARSLYSHKQCNNKNVKQLQEMCFQAGKNWNDLPTALKRGRCVVKKTVEKEAINLRTQQKEIVIRSEWQVDNEIPIFSKDRNYIDQYLLAPVEEMK